MIVTKQCNESLAVLMASHQAQLPEGTREKKRDMRATPPQGLDEIKFQIIRSSLTNYLKNKFRQKDTNFAF